MSRSANKKNKVRKISEEEYAKYINALKSGGRENALLAEDAQSEEGPKEKNGGSY